MKRNELYKEEATTGRRKKQAGIKLNHKDKNTTSQKQQKKLEIQRSSNTRKRPTER
jgi:hypothetical protein